MAFVRDRDSYRPDLALVLTCRTMTDIIISVIGRYGQIADRYLSKSISTVHILLVYFYSAPIKKVCKTNA